MIEDDLIVGTATVFSGATIEIPENAEGIRRVNGRVEFARRYENGKLPEGFEAVISINGKKARYVSYHSSNKPFFQAGRTF